MDITHSIGSQTYSFALFVTTADVGDKGVGWLMKHGDTDLSPC